ncbi:MAG TPA: hypothetical protein VIL46_16715 [Gemmataceae bacterium]
MEVRTLMRGTARFRRHTSLALALATAVLSVTPGAGFASLPGGAPCCCARPHAAPPPAEPVLPAAATPAGEDAPACCCCETTEPTRPQTVAAAGPLRTVSGTPDDTCRCRVQRTPLAPPANRDREAALAKRAAPAEAAASAPALPPVAARWGGDRICREAHPLRGGTVPLQVLYCTWLN